MTVLIMFFGLAWIQQVLIIIALTFLLYFVSKVVSSLVNNGFDDNVSNFSIEEKIKVFLTFGVLAIAAAILIISIMLFFK